MANAIYTSAKVLAMAGGWGWTTNNIKCVLMDAADVAFTPATHDFEDDLTTGIEEESANMTSKTTTGGTLDCADFSFTAAAGDPCEYLVWFNDTGTPATSDLLFGFDTATGLPVTLGGGDVDIALNASGLIAPMGT